jgi:hypothetical protein
VNDARATELRDVLHTVAETHHVVYGIVDGADDDWASWYAAWLIDLSELPRILGSTPVRSELTYHLVRLDKEYRRAQPSEPWEEVYARELLEVLGSDPSTP